MTDCPACFLLLHCLGSGWVHLLAANPEQCFHCPLPNPAEGAVSSSSPWVSPTSQVVSNTSWRMHILLLLTSQGQWWSQVSNAAWSSALPSALAGKAQGKRHPWPCQLLFLHQSSHPSKVCTWGTTLARLLRPLPPCSVQSLSCCPHLLPLVPWTAWTLNCWVVCSTWPRAQTPRPSSYTSPKWGWQRQGLIQMQVVLHFTPHQEHFILMLAGSTAVPLQESLPGILLSNSEGAFRELGSR